MNTTPTFTLSWVVHLFNTSKILRRNGIRSEKNDHRSKRREAKRITKSHRSALKRRVQELPTPPLHLLLAPQHQHQQREGRNQLEQPKLHLAQHQQLPPPPLFPPNQHQVYPNFNQTYQNKLYELQNRALQDQAKSSSIRASMGRRSVGLSAKMAWCGLLLLPSPSVLRSCRVQSCFSIAFSCKHTPVSVEAGVRVRRCG